MFYAIQYKNGCLAASDLFHMTGVYIPLSRVKEYRCLQNVIHQIDNKHEWLLLSASFTAEFGLVFVLENENNGKRFFLEV